MTTLDDEYGFRFVLEGETEDPSVSSLLLEDLVEWIAALFEGQSNERAMTHATRKMTEQKQLAKRSKNRAFGGSSESSKRRNVAFGDSSEPSKRRRLEDPYKVERSRTRPAHPTA